ncbi:hypothetical protein HNP46_003980 [Pseudomonas nitritireducens]|uniref:Lipoprotein n=1 Tax=Pseudomonas nitroreducens TaxID=46680 RepID=A0A7W7KMN4_PSENT|nr:hypothetical protein [Pseudomonas nitritireducens]MBB4865104.1 hypothetical protein [Pseudomonas nitritireducens]
MKRNVLLACFALLALSGCDEAVKEKPQAQAVSEVPSLSTSDDGQQVVTFKDGASITLKGKLIRNVVFSNDSGKFQRYIFELDEQSMAIEGRVFATIVKAGYQRKVKTSNADTYAVHYQKRGYPAVGATYANLEGGKGDAAAKTRLTLLWRI